MKYKTTKKEVMSGYEHIIMIGYCGLQSLLSHRDPIAYTVRPEGWGADIYDFGNIAIVTGYAPFGNINPSYQMCQQYEKRAENVMKNQFSDWGHRALELDAILNDFLTEATK